MKAELERSLPYMSVEAIPTRVERALADGLLRLEEYDLVVVALGVPTVELYLNELVHRSPRLVPAVFTWLEPYGIGGHALLTNNGGEAKASAGCLQCLHSDVHDDPPMYNRASFAAPAQEFAKSVAGCGGLYTPYGALDAVRTSAMAARLAVDQLESRVDGNPLLSWKGDPHDFIDAGYVLSDRSALDDSALARTEEYVQAGCVVCGGSMRDHTHVR